MSALYLDQHASHVDYYNSSSLKQRSVGRHVTPLGHIIRTNPSLFLLFSATYRESDKHGTYYVFRYIVLPPPLHGEGIPHLPPRSILGICILMPLNFSIYAKLALRRVNQMN